MYDTMRMLRCAERELEMRRCVYKARVRLNHMRKETSDYELESMQMIVDHFKALLPTVEPTSRPCECEETSQDCDWHAGVI